MPYDNNAVLVVDDSPSDVELAIHALKQCRRVNAVVVAEDGEQALDYLFCRGSHAGRNPSDRPAVVLLDLKLPKIDGLGILKTIRSDERTRAIPVVIFTSSKEAQDVIEGYRLGTNAFVQKPVDFEQFRNTIKDIGTFWMLANEPPPPEAFLE